MSAIDGESQGAVSRTKDGSAAALDEVKATRKLRNGFISLVILLALVAGLLVAVPGLSGVAHAVTNMELGWVSVAVVLEVLSCASYILAFFQVFDRAPLRFGARVALSELAFGAAVSVGGAGSVAVGAWLLITRGAPATRVAERSAVLFLFTSAINLITITLTGVLSFFGILPGSTNPLLTLLPAAVGAIAFAFFLALPKLVEQGIQRRAPGKVRLVLETTAMSVRDTVQLLRRPDWRIIGAIGYLWFDIGVLVACFAALGSSPPLASIVLAYQVAYISNLIPIPGGIGVLDGSLVGMLLLYGVSATKATAAAVVYHAIALWIPAMWGTVAFLLLQRSRNEPITPRPPREERLQARRDRRAQRHGDATLEKQDAPTGRAAGE